MELKPRREKGTLLLYCVGILFGLALLAFAIYNLVTANGTQLISISSILLAMLVIWMVANNLFMLKYIYNEADQSITIQSGRSKENFKFKDVKEVSQVRSFFPQGTVAREKIKITFDRHLAKDSGPHTVYMATTDDKAFLEFLKTH